MGFSLLLGIASAALLIALLDLWYLLYIKRRIFYTLKKIELEQKRSLFDSLGTHSATIDENTDDVIKLVKRVKEMIISRLNLRPGLTYPQLIRELDNRGVPAELRDKISDMFNQVMRLEYSNKKIEDKSKILAEAKQIIKILGLSQSTTAESK